MLEPRVLLAAALISIRATDNVAAESTGRPNAGAIVIERTGRDVSGVLDVAYSVGGSAAPADFVALPGHASIPAGKKSITVPILAVDDAIAEDPETVVVSLLASDAYSLDPNAAKRTATVTIADNEPIVSIVRTKDASEGKTAPIGGVFTVKRAGSDVGAAVRVEYSLAADSSAAAGDDFQALAGFVDIPAGKREAKVIMNPVADLRPERPEAVHLVLTPADRYRVDARQASATILITEVPRVDFLGILGWNHDGRWQYALTGDSLIGNERTHADARATGTIEAADATSTWSMAVSDFTGSPNATFILPVTTYERRNDGVYLTQISNNFGGSTGSATWTFTGLRLTPRILEGAATGRGACTLSTVYGDLNGTASSKVTLSGLEAVTVPAGTFDAAKMTMTMQLRGSGRVTGMGQTANVSFSETVTITFWAVQDVGPVKITQAVAGTVAGGGGSLRFSATAVGALASR